MYRYELNIAHKGRHWGRVDLGRIAKGDAIDRASFMENSLNALSPMFPEYEVTLHEYPAVYSNQIAFKG